jgi:hypothetical protein
VTDEEPQPPTREDTRLHARLVLQNAGLALDKAVNDILATQAEVDTWTPEFWADSGYTKAEAMTALAHLENLRMLYHSEYAEKTKVLRVQAP